MNFPDLDILIVEYSDEMLWSFANILEQAGFKVDGVLSGASALDYMQKNQNVKLLIINNVLPDMGALSLMKKIKRRFGIVDPKNKTVC
jgi:DNA-binding response OmpR family regulator